MADGDINRIREQLDDLHFKSVVEKQPVLVSLKFDDGGFNLATNNSGQTEPAWCGPAPGKKWAISGLHVNIQDDGQFGSIKYGAITGLTNGIWMAKTSGSNTSEIMRVGATDDLRIKHNGDIAKYADMYRYVTFVASSDDMILAEFHFPSMWETDFELNGDKNERLVVYMNDNFTGLVEHQWVAHGYELDIV
jgi:hypothetical protein